MYLHIGQDYILSDRDVLGVFDMDNTSSSYRTRAFLARTEQEGAVIPLSEDIPKSFILTDWPADTTLYLSPFAASTIAKRAADPVRELKALAVRPKEK